MILRILNLQPLALLFGLLILPTIALAQTAQEDVLYLKDGSVIRGEMIEYDTKGMVKVRIVGGSILAYPFESVVKMERADRYPVKGRGNSKSEIQLKHEGWYGFLELGVGFMSQSEWRGLDADITIPRVGAGYRFNRWFGPGISTGMYIVPDGLIILPLRGYVEGILLPGAIAPFYYAGAGYGFIANPTSTNDAKDKGGPGFEAGLGLRFHTRSGTAFQVRMGQNSQKVTLTNNSWWWPPTTTSKREITYNSIQLSLGVSF